MENYKFDYISNYKVLSEGYCDPPVWATYGSGDEAEYVVERGYEIKNNGNVYKVHDWTFINMKLWRIYKYNKNKLKYEYKGDYESLALALARVKELSE